MTSALRHATVFALCAFVLAQGACRREAFDPPPPIMAGLEQNGGRMTWTGMQACADCDGIDTRLLLIHDGGRREYMLEEIYLAPSPVPFVSKGRWRLQRGLLWLTAADGAATVYAVLGDGGALQPRDGRGRRLANNDGDGLLMPVSTEPKP